MSRLNWTISREYEQGVDRGVFYPLNGPAEVWNGLISVVENASDPADRVRYIDGRKIVNARREDSFSATVSAFTHPSSFLLNPRTPFGFSYRVQTDKSYKIHLVFNALATISGRNYGQEDTPDPFNFSISTRPLPFPDSAPTAHLVIDADQAYSSALSTLEDFLYGSDAETPRLPSPQELFDIFEANALLTVTDHGDGTFTVDGPDEAIQMLDATTFQITWPSAVYISEDTYKIRSL